MGAEKGLTKERSAKRQTCVLDLREQGLTMQQVGDNCGGLSRQAVQQRLNYTPRIAERLLKRSREIAFLLSLGLRGAEVAREIGTFPETVCRIAARYNLRKRAWSK